MVHINHDLRGLALPAFVVVGALAWLPLITRLGVPADVGAIVALAGVTLIVGVMGNRSVGP